MLAVSTDVSQPASVKALLKRSTQLIRSVSVQRIVSLPRAGLLIVLFAGASTSLLATDPVSILTKGFEQMRAGECGSLPATLEPLLKSKGTYQASAYRLLSDCYLKTNQIHEASDTLREGLKNTPGSAILERSLGELLFHQNFSNSEAGELLRKATESLPRDPESRHFYAQWAYLNNRKRCAWNRRHKP